MLNKRLLTGLLLVFMFLTFGLIARDYAQAQSQYANKIGDEVLETLKSKGEARVVIALVEPAILKNQKPDLVQVREDVASLQAGVLANLETGKFTLTHQYQAIPALAGNILDESVLYQLAANPAVRKIDLDVGGSGHLATSVPLIGADTWHTAGNTGGGVVVAVLDSGLDTDHSDLAAGLIHQACFLDDDGSINGVGLCPNGSDRQTGPGAAEDDAGHGTHVTGIVASRGNQSSVGVAPGANIVSIKVTAGPSFSGTFYYFSEIVAALDYILNVRTDVKVINMSFGTFAQFVGDCDNATSWNMAGATAINNLRAQGVIAFASSGNNGSDTEMGSPACLSNVIAVGATDNSDNLATFTNSNTSTDILAPGVSILSSAMGNSTTTASGTSMASPHAAGCAALLIAGGEATTPDQIETRLETSSTKIFNPNNGLIFPRIDCNFPAVTSVEISGPAAGFPDYGYTFSATSNPITATLPITYTWQATGQSPVVQTTELSTSIAFGWEITGTKTITVTAENLGSTVMDTHTIQILDIFSQIFLPLILR